MAVSPEDVASRLRTQAQANDRIGRQRAEGLRSKLGEAAIVLRAAGARRVWLFGSLASGAPHAESDVDLAVEGLAGASYFDALALLMTLFRTRVDLVTLEDAPESLRERILATGREL